MLKCEEVLDKMSDYIDNYLPENEKIEFENHMQTCKSCEMEFDNLEKIILKLKHIQDVEPPTDLKSKIMDKIQVEESNSKSKIIAFKQYYSLVATFTIFVIGMYIVDLTSIFEEKSSIKLVQQDYAENEENDSNSNFNSNSNEGMQSMTRGIIADSEEYYIIDNNQNNTDVYNNSNNSKSIDFDEATYSNINNNEIEFFGKTLFKEEQSNFYSHKIDFMQNQEYYKISFENTSSNIVFLKFIDNDGNQLLDKVVEPFSTIFFEKYNQHCVISYEDENGVLTGQSFIIDEILNDIIYYIELDTKHENHYLEGTFKIQDI